ncbi:MAG TPA: S41 family peptidase [Acidimicrobiia bacterium]|nr:S41 family peptidase [Acidimicrobiia bacterium]
MILRKVTLVALALTFAACTSGQGSESSTTAVPTETTATTGAGPTSTQTPGTPAPTSDRPLELVGCDDTADEDILIVCETFDIILDNYVDAVEPAHLAEAAKLGLATLDGSDSEAELICATPDESFTEVCAAATVAAEDSGEAAEAMVAGMTSYGLDPNSAYLDPNALALLEEEQEGQIEGIGALVSPEDQTIEGENKQCGIVSETCRLLIVSTIEGAPADGAGLMRDDVLVEVDGEPIMGWTVDEVTSAVRGPAGTDVTLTLERNGVPYDVTITRAAVVIPLIVSETIGDIGYVGLTSFGGNAGSQFEEAVVDRLADGVDELVIDLRNNPGGFLTTAIEVASLFLEDGDVVVTEGPGESKSYPVEGDAVVPEDMKVYFVVNKGSASASEVVAAALQERGRAEIVGENTFGKNTVQQRFSLANEGALKLTIARWLTPGGLDFGGTGITPDVELDVENLTPEELVAEVAGA